MAVFPLHIPGALGRNGSKIQERGCSSCLNPSHRSDTRSRFRTVLRLNWETGMPRLCDPKVNLVQRLLFSHSATPGLNKVEVLRTKGRRSKHRKPTLPSLRSELVRSASWNYYGVALSKSSLLNDPAKPVVIPTVTCGSLETRSNRT